MKTALRFGRFEMALLAGLVVLGTVGSAMAQNVRIRYRPLTPRELTEFGLPPSTQKSGGAPNVGLGQPVYAEALVQDGTVVTGVTWTIISAPSGSTAVMLPSPLSNAVPTYDGGDRIGFFVAGRAVLKPDIASSYDFGLSQIIDYKIKTDILLTNKVLSFTNSAYGAKYLGQKHYLCVLCHADKQAGYDQTAHATALQRKIVGVSSNHFQGFCVPCHSIGNDPTPGAVNDGFDDIAAQVGWTFPGSSSPTNWTGMPTNLQQRGNIQCENCHGAASTHMVSLGQIPAIDTSLSAGSCGQCHDSPSYYVKNMEWGHTLHATGQVFKGGGPCAPCHSAKGFIKTYDPFYVQSGKTPRATDQEGVACVACHDPHTVGMGASQLRNIPTAKLSNGYVAAYAQVGEGVLCMNCHHARANGNVLVANLSSTNVNPHASPQADMLLGQNGIEYGLAMPKSRHATAVENSCVGCHMQLVAGTSYSHLNTLVGGHTFSLTWRGPTNTVQVTEICAKCHVEDTFDIKAEDYDRNGTIDGVQTEIEGLLAQLGKLLPPVGSTSVVQSLALTPAQRKAAYNFFFVREDRSRGVHNPKYAAALLQASIDDLQGGIDVDRDGLPDWWEMQKFGSLTAQTGNGDADGDGVSNLLEYQLGLNPNNPDTDGDGVSDLAELQAGSDPLNPLSTPPVNAIFAMQGALELGYMPDQAGVTQRFEYVDAMGNGGGWTNVGGAFISSNSPTYQLISLRDSTNKFYRVTKP